MRYINRVALILLPVFMLSLTGCGNSSNGSTATDPLGSNNQGAITTPPLTVRSEVNIINFVTTKNTTDPNGNLNTLIVSIDGTDPLMVPSYNILQLVPFEVLDSNGFPRTLVPVKLSIYSVLGGCTVFTDSPESGTERTVTTDNTGLGVFNSYVNISTPPIGSENSCAIIYKATTPDPYAAVPTDLFSYGAYLVTLKNIKTN